MLDVNTAANIIVGISYLFIIWGLVKLYQRIPASLKMKGLLLEISILIIILDINKFLEILIPPVATKWVFIVEKALTALASVLLAYVLLTQSSKVGKHLRKQEELAQKLRESEHRFQLYMDNSPALKFIKSNGKIIYQNKRFRDIYGNLIGSDYHSFLEPESNDLVKETDEQVLETKETLTIEEKFLLPDGNSKVYSVNKFWMDDEMLGVSAFDITELKEIYAELEELMYAASHDLRSPLRAFRGYIELLTEALVSVEKTSDQEERINHCINRSLAAVDRMGLLLEGLLLYNTSRHAVPALIQTSLQSCYDDAVENLMSSIEEKQASVVCQKSLPLVLGDKSQLTQVFQNLIGNALKFCPPERKPSIEVGYNVHSKNALIFVKDNGIGIDEKYHKKIFSLLQKINGSDYGGGTGLGLAICKKILKNHQGNIYVKSEFGKGSIFYFTLKLCNPQNPIQELTGI